MHSNSWYWDYLNDVGGRLTGGTASPNVLYEIEWGNRYVKNLKTGTNFASGNRMTTELGETYYGLNGLGRTASGTEYYSRKYWFKVYNSSNELIGHCVPCKHKVGGVEYKGWLNIVTLVFSYNTEGSFTISETPAS